MTYLKATFFVFLAFDTFMDDEYCVGVYLEYKRIKEIRVMGSIPAQVQNYSSNFFLAEL